MSIFLTERIKIVELINNCIQRINKVTDTIIVGNFKNKGKFSDVFACHFKPTLTCGKKHYFSIKIIPLSPNAKSSLHDTRFSIWREIMALRWCTSIVKSRITQNLPIIYDYFLIRDIPHLNKYIDTGSTYKLNKLGVKRYDIVLLNELAQMDIHTWVTHQIPEINKINKTQQSNFKINLELWKLYQTHCKNCTGYLIDNITKDYITDNVYIQLCTMRDNFRIENENAINMIEKQLIHNATHNTNEWYNAYFQIFSALYVLQKKMKMFHNDLHWGNVLVVQNKTNGYWRYIIDGVNYYVPNNGCVFKIWDFGMARSDYYAPMETWRRYDPNKLQSMSEQEHNYEYDEIYRKIYGLDTLRISNIPKWCSHNDNEKIYGQSPIEFIERFFKPIHTMMKSKDDTRPQILLLKLFGLYRHDKIGNLLSQQIAKKTVNFDNSKLTKHDLKIGQLVVLNVRNTYKIVEINCMLPNEPHKIQILYERMTNKYANIDIKYIYTLNRHIRTQYEIDEVKCLGVFELDTPIDLVTKSECECEILPVSHPMIQSITNYIDDFKRMEFTKRFT